MSHTSFDTALKEIIEFRDEREWKQFHTPKDLAVALSVEASELLELFLWKNADEIERLLKDDALRARVEEEVGDVLIYTLILCHEVGMEPGGVIAKKLRRNKERYPVHRARGSAKKYNELDG